jgi:deazaflavin-dependent oxidoreductase (nitroreductase family)
VANTYRLGATRRAVNVVMTALARRGLAGRHTYILTVRGRKTGRPYSNPVILIEDAERWLVAPYGDVAWVRNARAVGEIELRHARRSETLQVEELTPQQAAPVLRTYLKRVAVVRPFFDVTADSPIEAIEAEAPRHPVFRLSEAQAASS